MHEDLAFIPSPPGLPLPATADSTRYLIVRLSEHGHIEIQGSREEVEQFLVECARSGLLITLDHLSWCG